MVTLLPTDGARAVIDRFRAEWTGMDKSEQSLPLRGVMRLVVLADTDAEALSTAERSYASWLGHMRHLWDKHGMEFPLRLPPVVGPMLEVGAAFAGTAAGFRDFVADHVEAIGANYMTCDVAFGDMTFDEAMQTTELIGRVVMPAFAE
jgi:hypothetical protein